MYGATSADFTIASGGRVISGAVLTLWTARTGGTRSPTCSTSTRWPAPTVTSAADRSVVYYRPNNDKTVHWADSGQKGRGIWRYGPPTSPATRRSLLSIGTVGTGTAAASLTGTSEGAGAEPDAAQRRANGVDTRRDPDSAVTSAKIADNAVTDDKIASGVTTVRLYRRQPEGRCGVGRHVLTPDHGDP